MLSLRCSEPVVSERARQIRIKQSPSVFYVNDEAVPCFILKESISLYVFADFSVYGAEVVC